jgi:hypothetical protein
MPQNLTFHKGRFSVVCIGSKVHGYNQEEKEMVVSQKVKESQGLKIQGSGSNILEEGRGSIRSKNFSFFGFLCYCYSKCIWLFRLRKKKSIIQI